MVQSSWDSVDDTPLQLVIHRRNIAGSQVRESYPLNRIKYCNWFRFTGLSSPLDTWYSSSPSTSTGGGGGTTCPCNGSSTPASKSKMGCTRWIRIDTGNPNWVASGDTCFFTWKGPRCFQWSLWVGLVVRILRASSYTLDPTLRIGVGIRLRCVPSSWTTWLRLISTGRCSLNCCIVAWTRSAIRCHWSVSCISFPAQDICESIPWTAQNGVHFVGSDTPLLAANSGRGNHCTQSSCWWLMKTRRYCSIPTLIRSVWPSVCGWNAVDIRRSIPNWPHTCLHKTDTNRGSSIRNNHLWQAI
jgi:hypothetical protein